MIQRILDWFFDVASPYLLGGACLAVALSEITQADYAAGLLFVPLGLVYVGFRRLRRLWIRSGYMNARAELLAALDEADKRGLDHGTFWIAQYEKAINDLAGWR